MKKFRMAVSTDFVDASGSPEPPLRMIAEAGFTHLHWCHQWCTDFFYGKYEIAAIRKWLKDYHLTLLDIHGSRGREKCYDSVVEYERKEGVELVRNRIHMLRELEGTGTVMMHVPSIPAGITPERRVQARACFDAVRRSFDELLPDLQRENVKIAVENMWGDTWEYMDELFDSYSPEFVGLCYDSGHANSNVRKQMDDLDRRKDRLEALHLHDNDGMGDLHQPPFYGSVDWERLAKILRESSYKREISFEMSMRNTPFFVQDAPGQTEENIRKYLADTYERCERFTAMCRA